MSGLEGFCSSKVTHAWQTQGSEGLAAVTGSSASLVTPPHRFSCHATSTGGSLT